MKKKIISLALVLLFTFYLLPSPANAEQPADVFASTAKAYVLMEATTGQIIIENNADEAFHAAGVSKLMSYLLFCEALASGAVKAEDTVKVSADAAKKGGTRVFLDAGSAYSFDTLLKPAIVSSANDATTALAEHIAGTEAAFVEKMNARGNELGLSATFVDATGLSGENKTSAKDLAKIAAELSKYSGFFKHSTEWTYTFTHESGRETEVTNGNTLIKDGTCDGMATGSTPESGYSVAASAKTGAARFICIVLGDKDSSSRFSFAREAISYATATFGVKQIAQDGAKFKTVPVESGTKAEVDIVAKADLSILYKKGEEANIGTTVELDELVAPLNAGDVVGKIIVNTAEGETTIALAVAEDVEQKSFIAGIKRIARIWVNGAPA